MEHVGLTKQLFGWCKMELNIFFHLPINAMLDWYLVGNPYELCDKKKKGVTKSPAFLFSAENLVTFSTFVAWSKQYV